MNLDASVNESLDNDRVRAYWLFFRYKIRDNQRGWRVGLLNEIDGCLRKSAWTESVLVSVTLCDSFRVGGNRGELVPGAARARWRSRCFAPGYHV